MKLNTPFWFIIGTIITILVLGCSSERIVYQNQTIIREIEKPCPACVCEACEECAQPDYSSYVKQVAKAQSDLNFCHIQQDLLDEMLTDCRLQNTTQYVGDIGDNYTICMREWSECAAKIGNITEII